MIAFLIIFLIVLLAVLCIASFGYYKLIKRCYSKNRIIIWIISIVLGLITTNFFNIYGLFALHFLIFTYVIELIYYLLKKVTKKEFIKFEKIKKICIIPLIFTILYFTYGYYNMQNIAETNYNIETEKEIHKNYKIVLLTDLHYGSFLKKNRLEEAINKINSLNPDIIILGGDMIDEQTDKVEMKEIFETLGKFNPSLGIYYVYGNHDKQNYSRNRKYTTEELENEITKNNIIILNDEVKILNEDIIIYGREDISSKRKDLSEYINLEENDKKFSIMIDHQPLDYDTNEKISIDLIVSGHTHAGQIFPSRSIIEIFKTADLSYGYKKYKNLNAIVSSGLSGWGYPIRTEKHSEYVVIDIIKK